MTYQISTDGRTITCTICGMTSWHPEDVARKYCGHCHIFHDDLPLLPETTRETLLAKLQANTPRQTNEPFPVARGLETSSLPVLFHDNQEPPP